MLDDENPRYRELANEQFCGCWPTYPRCKDDCYWYDEWQDMGGHIPYCRCKRAVSIEPKDCENCEQYHSKYKPTNADKIRKKSDEELAKWIVHKTEGNGFDSYDESVKAWLDWLKQEVSDAELD